MSQHQPFGHGRSHFDSVQNAINAQRSVVQNLCSTVNRFLTNSLTSLDKEESKGDIENDSCKRYNPQTHPNGKFTTEIIQYSFHSD